MKASKIALIYLLSQSTCLYTTAQLANAPLQRVRQEEPGAKQSFAQRVQASRLLKRSKEGDGPAFGKEQNPPSGSMPLNVAEISMPLIESEISMPLIESEISMPLIESEINMSFKYETAEIAGGYVADDTSSTPKLPEVTDEATSTLDVVGGAVMHASGGDMVPIFAKAAKAATVKQTSSIASGAVKLSSKARRMKELRTDQKKRNMQGFTWSDESVSMSLPPADIVDSIDSAIPVHELIEDAVPVPVVTGKADKDHLKPIVPARLDLSEAVAAGHVPGEVPAQTFKVQQVEDDSSSFVVTGGGKGGKRERQMKQLLRADQKGTRRTHA